MRTSSEATWSIQKSGRYVELRKLYIELLRRERLIYISNKVHGWSYTEAKDLGNICEACLRKDGLGFQIFNAVNDEITNETPTKELLGKFCPGTDIKSEIGRFDAPVSNRKLKEMIGFNEEFGWKKRWGK